MLKLLKRNKLSLHFGILMLFLLVSASKLSAQNLGEYVYPYDNNQIELKEETTNTEEIHTKVKDYLSAQGYVDFEFEIENIRSSINTSHYTFQVLIQHKPLDQAKVKVHVTENRINLLQHNLPDLSEWNALKIVNANLLNGDVWLIVDKQLLLAEKKQRIIEKEDFYANIFSLQDGSFFENSIKYHIDSTAYGRVFNPDPLSSSGQNYGGNYQDGFTKDTAGLLIQNITNPGGNTVTANATNYNYDGQTFNVATESYVNTSTAPVLRQVFETINLDGQGTILGYTTAITDNLAAYVTQIIQEDYNYPELEAEQVWRSFPLDYSGGTFNLTNDFFIISEFSNPITNPAISVTDSFDYTRNEVPFEDVNAFYHLNNYKIYWESLGFTDLASELILIDTHGNNGADNSFFSPTSPPRLVFGQGGVDDAEDADVIIHEYGHGISYFASPNTNSGNQRRALDEGFGDYLAFSYSRALTPFNAFNTFSWDGHNEFWNGRVANSPKTALDIDEGQGIYYNGEVWAATLKDLHSAVGRTICDQLAIEVMYYNMPNGSLTQAALNLFKADTALYNGIHSCDIFQVLFGRKFVLGTCTDFYAGTKDIYSTDGQVSVLNTLAFANGNGNLIIQSESLNLEGSDLQILDVNGKLVHQIVLDQDMYELKALPFSSGIYFMSLKTKKGIYRFKIMKN